MKVNNVVGKAGVLLLLAVGALAILNYYYGVAGGRLPFSSHRYTVSAVVSEPQQLLKHADVRAAGVTVGTVADITNRGQVAKVKLELQEDVLPLYTDATVLVRQKTLVGENYIEIDPGNPAAGLLRDGSTLSLRHDREAVPLDRVLSSLDTETRRRVRDNLRALGGGFRGRGGDLSRALDSLHPLLTDGSQVMDVLGAQRIRVASVVQDAGTIMRSFADRGRDLQTLARSAKVTAESVQQRDTAVKQSFDALPPTLLQARMTVANLARFSTQATPVVKNIRVAMRDVTPVLSQLRETIGPGQALFERLPALMKRADPLLKRLPGFASTGQPVMPALEALLRQANPALAYLKPYYKDLGSTFSNFGTAQEWDRYGTQIRCGCPVSDRTFSNWTPPMRKAMNALLKAGVLAQIEGLQQNPLRAPGSLPSANAPFTGTYPRVVDSSAGK